MPSNEQTNVQGNFAVMLDQGNWPLFHTRFQRNRFIKLFNWPIRTLIFLEPCRFQPHFSDNWGPCVIPLKLPNLPLPRQHPERVTHFSPQSSIEFVRPRPTLESIPKRNSGYPLLGNYFCEISCNQLFRSHGSCSAPPTLLFNAKFAAIVNCENWVAMIVAGRNGAYAV